MFRFLVCVFFFIVLSCNTNETKTMPIKEKKIVVAHRGASGYLPEHSLESKAMAYAMNIDFIEQDIVLSKDNIPIIVHDIHLETVTDVAIQFPNRNRADGRYYVIDFTFEELTQLNVSERFNPTTKEAVYPKRFPLNKSTFKLHSLQQEIELIQGLNKSTGKNIGIYPEIKEPLFHQKEGKDISKIVLEVLSNYGYKTKNDNCILQCFDAVELKRIRTELKSELFLVQLIEFEEEESKLEAFAKYADGIGPWYKQIIKGKNEDGTWQLSNLVTEAHELNLKVHSYTFRADELGNFENFEELLNVALYQANIDGVFTDFPDKVADFINKN
ncbi:MAG: glycerophosphodiester phosphodiesterase [Lutibacter sp.]|uniref:glycerophosphodiester phosphodiesterase n=1 Tax=Lutibacter sp. TaxID=1925666 RepID=UPI0018436D30|nr:glycerophosphodiester phosphodiesterase [Lutibacter sp.]MBT8316661.1 glycerophosphodiester phosphodiesterase [Lutibacter sp.]NNJ57521.1 glycerophosphodiester phosphodiesterase [Lutibacter sp.]